MVVSKITTTIPTQLKKELVNLKDELHLSMATICRDALEQYLEAKEVEKWEKGTKLAQDNSEYAKLCNKLGNSVGEIYDY